MSSLEIGDHEIPKAFSLLSVERMAVLQQITGNERDSLDLHHQMLIVAAAMMPVTAMIEICLRNAVSDRLRPLFKTADWLQSPPPPFEWRKIEKDKIRNAKRAAQRAVYAKKTQFEKRTLDRLAYPNGIPANLSHKIRVNQRQIQIQITVGQLVAQLTLGHWKRLFSSDYQSLWDRSLKRIFSDRSTTRAGVAENLEVIHQARNRIAHHELLYGPRLDTTVKAIDFIVGAFGPKSANSQTLLELMVKPHRLALQVEADKLAALVSKFTVSNVDQ